MARHPKYDVLFEPIAIGSKVSKNRFYQTPHCTGLGSQYPGAQAYHRGVKAEGGWGVVNTEYCSIHPEEDDHPYIAARLWDDSDIRNLSLMVNKVHEHGSLAGVELHYGGVHSTNYEARMVSRGISQIVSDTWLMHSCTEMDKSEIRELQQFYVAAAVRARAAGFDIIDLHGREVATILVHFLMRSFNKRTDEYGGSLENRARFWLETLEQVRAAVGDDCAIVAGLTVDSTAEDDSGIRVDEEGIGFVELADHLVDLWNVQVGGRTEAEWTDDAGPSRFFPQNSQKLWIEKLRPHTNKPIVGVGRFTDPDVMVDVIRSGQLDIIGAARPSIADPFLPKKIEEGRFGDIRECIGCNICVSRFNQGAARIVCTQNATTGEEYRRGWNPERFDRARNADSDVLIVGAGPAGMECAMVLGKRGLRRVHLVDGESDIGGALSWISTLPGLGEWARVINYRRIQLDRLDNVEVITNVRLEATEVREYGAELVVVATGAHWSTDGMNGYSHRTIPGADASLPHVLTPEQAIVGGKDVPGDRVLVYDCDGYFVGVSLAEKMALDGKRVTVVSPLDSVAPFMVETGEAARMYQRLLDLGVELAPGHEIVEVGPDRAQGVGGLATGASRGVSTHRSGKKDQMEWQYDAIVLVTQRVSDDRLYRELRADTGLPTEGVRGVYRIGDCVAPRIIADCIFDGHRLGREIDTENPAMHLPYIREHRILGNRDADYDNVLNGGGKVQVSSALPVEPRRTTDASVRRPLATIEDVDV